MACADLLINVLLSPKLDVQASWTHGLGSWTFLHGVRAYRPFRPLNLDR